MAVYERDVLILGQTPLFSFMSSDEIIEALGAIKCHIRSFKRGEIMMHSGDVTDMSGLIMRGEAAIRTAPNFDGNQKTIVRIGVGEMYGEPFNCLSYSAVPITVIAGSDVQALLLDVRTIFSANCSDKIVRRLLSNLSIQFAEKIVVFRNKVEVLSQPTLKWKVLTTIKQYAEYQNTLNPRIPFSKVDWGEYLAANRNSVARVIKELQEEGIIRVIDDNYELLKAENMMFIQRSGRSPHNTVHARVDSNHNLAAIASANRTT